MYKKHLNAESIIDLGKVNTQLEVDIVCIRQGILGIHNVFSLLCVISI
jgi:hypothetical protein